MFVIQLSNEGDHLYKTGPNSFRSTLNVEQASRFETLKEAKRYMVDMSLKFLWPEAQVREV